MQFKFADIASAKEKCKEILEAHTILEDGSLYIIKSVHNNEITYYVEDGVPFIRNYETIIKSFS